MMRYYWEDVEGCRGRRQRDWNGVIQVSAADGRPGSPAFQTFQTFDFIRLGVSPFLFVIFLLLFLCVFFLKIIFTHTQQLSFYPLSFCGVGCCMSYSMYVEVRGQLRGTGSLFLSREFQAWSSSPRPWQQTLLSTKSSRWSQHIRFL